MISVENFYWAMHENLLKPLNFVEYVFYPFGSTSLDDLNINEFVENNDKHIRPYVWTMPFNRSLFFDQEPMGRNTISVIDEILLGGQKNMTLLANSEISSIKAVILKKYRVFDWYYFYHGFAALDWFRDAKYMRHFNHPIRNNFLSLNGIVTGDRRYRMILTAHLADRELLDKGSVSFHSKPGACAQELEESAMHFSAAEKQLVNQQLPLLNRSLYVDTCDHNPGNSAAFGHFEMKMFQQSFLHVVNETVFYYKKLHLTEKIFKPIVSRRPFILVAAPGNLAYLKRYGFQTFSKWINEDYDNETDHSRRLIMIADEIEKISKLSLAELNCMHQEMQEILDYNFDHFFGNFKSKIVDELVDNFHSCLLQWNNCRTDDRSLRTDLDWTAIKSLLKT